MTKKGLFKIYLLRLLAVTFIPLLLMTSIFYIFSTTGQKRALVKSEQQSFHTTADSFDEMFKNIFLDSSSLFYSPEIHYLLIGDSALENGSDKIPAIQEMIRKISSRFNTVSSAEVFFKNIGLVLSPDGFDLINSATGKDPQTSTVLKNMTLPKNIWVPQHTVKYPDMSREIISYILPLPINSDPPLGALVVNLDANKLINSSISRESGGEDVFVIDRENQVVFGNISRLDPVKVFSVDRLEKIRRKEIETETMYIKKQKKQVFYRVSAINDWIYIKVIPYSNIENNLQSGGSFAYLIAFGILLFGIGSAYMVSRKIYRPIGDMSNALKNSIPELVQDNEKLFYNVKGIIEQSSIENLNFKGLLEKNRELLRNSVLKEMLLNKDVACTELAGHLKILGVDFPYSCYCVFLLYLNDEEVEIKEDILNVLKQVILENHVGVFIFIKNNKICALLNLDNNGVEDKWEHLWDLGHQCNRALRNQFNLSLTMGIGSICKSLNEISTSYAIAEKALSYRHCFEKGALIFNHMISENSTNMFKYPYREEELLFDLIEQANLDDAVNIIERIFDEIKAQSQFFTCDYLKVIYTMLYNSFRRNSALRAIHWSEEEFNSVHLEIEQDRKSIDEIRDLFIGMIRDMAMQMNKRRDMNVSLEKAIDYINKNYINDIALDDLAAIAGLTPQYFSKVFKDYTQNTVVNYITDLRMEKSVDLLTHTNLSIKDIAEQVGYRNPQYFIRVFKKKFHLSPMQYKRRE